jgi:DNA-directed RNA polymerase subunit RPC12/RpoP
MPPQLEGGKTKEDLCPNCGQHLEKRPVRKAKCPHCGKFIFVRKPFLVTEKEAELTDEAARLEGIWITRETIDKHRANLAKKFGFDPSVHDILWGTLNANIYEHQGSPDDLRFTYNELGRILEIEGKDPSSVYAQAAKWELFPYLNSPLHTNVKVVNSNDDETCPKCRALSGREFPIKEAYKTLPAHSVCENKKRGCRCHYEPILDI